MEPLPVIAVRVLDGRVGSTLLLQLLATSDKVALSVATPKASTDTFHIAFALLNGQLPRGIPRSIQELLS